MVVFANQSLSVNWGTPDCPFPLFPFLAGVLDSPHSPLSLQSGSTLNAPRRKICPFWPHSQTLPPWIPPIFLFLEGHEMQ